MSQLASIISNFRVLPLPFRLFAIFWCSLPAFASVSFAETGGQPGWQKVLEAANKEGKVVAAIPTSPELRTGMEKAFGEKFRGIQLELVPGAATALASRIVSEYKAGVRNFDLFIAGTAVQLGVMYEGAVEPFEPYMVLPEVKDPKNWFGGHLWVDNKGTNRFVYPFQAYVTEPGWYNSELFDGEKFATFDDLLNPKLKGKIGIHEPRRPGTGQAVWIYLGVVKGEGFLRKLAEQDLVISADLRQLAEMLGKGRLALVLGPGYRVLAPFVQAGLPLKPIPVPKEGIHATAGVGAISVMKNAPHPNATKVFVNWLLSKEGQEIFGKATGQATRRLDVDTRWLSEVGIQAAKDSLTLEEYLKRESFFEDKIPLRKMPVELAEKLLR
jgi:ABC-type Fe3+ transport system substrate-binding protein